MWTAIAKSVSKFTTKVINTALIAITGYEIGNKVDNSNEQKITKETITITKDSGNNISIESIIFVVLIMVCLAIVIVSAQQLIKCISNKNKSRSQQNLHVIEMQARSVPRPAPREM